MFVDLPACAGVVQTGVAVVNVKDVVGKKGGQDLWLDLAKTVAAPAAAPADGAKGYGQVHVVVEYKELKDEMDVDEAPPGGGEAAVEKAPAGTPKGGGVLVVIVHKGEELEAKSGTPTAYVKLKYRNIEFKTKVRAASDSSRNVRPCTRGIYGCKQHLLRVCDVTTHLKPLVSVLVGHLLPSYKFAGALKAERGGRCVRAAGEEEREPGVGGAVRVHSAGAALGGPAARGGEEQGLGHAGQADAPQGEHRARARRAGAATASAGGQGLELEYLGRRGLFSLNHEMAHIMVCTLDCGTL